MKLRHNHNLAEFFRYAPLFLWIGVIALMSSGQASMANTSRIIRPLILFFAPSISEANLTAVHAFIRKTAHVTEYGILALFAALAFSYSTHNSIRRFWYFFAFGVVVLVASADETNQSFIPSRTSSVYDVLLDASSGLGVLLIFWVYRKFHIGKA